MLCSDRLLISLPITFLYVLTHETLISFCIITNHTILYHIILYHIILYHIILYHIKSHHIVSSHIVSYQSQIHHYYTHIFMFPPTELELGG